MTHVVRTATDVAQICSDLIRFDTSNPGMTERPAADYVATILSDLGLDPLVREAEPGRSNVVVRLAGRDRSAPAMLIHGHLDTVPAPIDGWTHHPHSGEFVNGVVWGRGAVDMKGAVAMMLAATARLVHEGGRPERDIVLAFVADEETGGRVGAQFLVEHHADLFEGCEVAIGEVGGFNASAIDGSQVFMISVADKGLRWYELRRRGIAGHGSMLPADNPIPGLADVLLDLTGVAHKTIVLPAMRELASALAGRDIHDDGEARDVITTQSGALSPMLAAGARNMVNVTKMWAGFKENVIPADAWARIDCRYLPGYEEDLHRALTDAIGDKVDVALVRRSPATRVNYPSDWFNHLAGAVRAVAPGARVAPYVFSGGTDNKWFEQLGMATFGFTPLLLPDSFDFAAMFHGVDERVPVSALEFGVDVLYRLLTT